MNHPSILTLPEQDVAAGLVDVVVDRVTRVDHEALAELHRLGALSAQLAGDHHLAALGAGLHDETEDAVAGTTHRQTAHQLVVERLCLGDGTQAAGGHLLGVQLQRAVREAEPLLHHRGQLADAAALLTCTGQRRDRSEPPKKHRSYSLNTVTSNGWGI